MILRWLQLGIVTLMVTGMWMSCGSDGDSDSGDSGVATEEQADPPGSVGSNGLTEVIGIINVGESGAPADTYEIWLLDHTNGSFTRQPLNDTGAFSFAIDDFVVGHIYSFYVVSGSLEAVGAIDFGTTAEGVQSALVYAGGLGFDMQTMNVKLDTLGSPDTEATTLATSPGGGFSIANDSDLSLHDLPGPEGLMTYGVGRDLTVVDPSTALYGVYLRAENDGDYRTMLAEHRRMRFWATYDVEQVSGLFLAEAGQWQQNARVVSRLDRLQDSAPLWRDTTYAVPSYSEGVFDGYVWVDDPEVVVLRAWVDGSAMELPASPKLTFSLPPRLIGVDMAGSAVSAIDYNTATENGLTVPFCFAGSDVTFSLAPPVDADGQVIEGDVLDQIHIQFAYFSGATEAAVSASDQSADYRNDSSVQVGDYTLNWHAAASAMEFTMSVAVFGNATHEVILPAELFITSGADQTITHIRTTIAFRDTEIADQAGIAVWFELSCD